MCGSMADIQSVMAEIRPGKKDRKEKRPQDKNIMVCPIDLLLTRTYRRYIPMFHHQTMMKSCQPNR